MPRVFFNFSINVCFKNLVDYSNEENQTNSNKVKWQAVHCEIRFYCSNYGFSNKMHDILNNFRHSVSMWKLLGYPDRNQPGLTWIANKNMHHKLPSRENGCLLYCPGFPKSSYDDSMEGLCWQFANHLKTSLRCSCMPYPCMGCLPHSFSHRSPNLVFC